ncbi:MAG TPA: DUF4382 domain-containing protein [Anaeromyxobacteraceae bacterium]|nr:DUF4382 domain-containing protein [Anaeromyxobacteraceae bacterium]
MTPRNRGLRNLGLLSLLLAAASCDPATVTGTPVAMSVHLTKSQGASPPAAVPLQKVNLHILTLEAHSSATGWVMLSEPNATYDLMHLTGGVVGTLASGVELESGKYTQFRLVLGPGQDDANGKISNLVVLNDGSVHDLTIPSALESGVSLNCQLDVQPGETKDVYIDFQMPQSIQIDATGVPEKYILRPVIHCHEGPATTLPPLYALTVQKDGAGSGTVAGGPTGYAILAGGGINCGATCDDSYPSGTDVALTATAAPGSTFAGWTGCDSVSDSVSGPTCNVTMTAGRIVTATFNPVQPVQYTLTVAKNGTGIGTVTSGGGAISCGATCSAPLDAGTAVTLTATPDATSTFASWVGCDSTSGTTCNVTMGANRTVTANFTRVQYALTVSKSGTGGGTVAGGGGGVAISCGATCSAQLDAGTAVTLTATPDATSTFASWVGCDSTSGTTCNVTMGANRTVTATFTRVQYTLTVSKGGTGAGTVAGGGGAISCGATCSASLDAGTPVVLTATPDATSTLASWVGCDSVSGPTCTLTMSGDRIVTATFDPVQYTLSVAKAGPGTGTVSGGGISCGATCSASLDPGTPVTLTAAAGAGSTFAGWTGCDSASGLTCTLTMNANRTVTATFNPVRSTLTVVKSGAGTGTVMGGPISCGFTCTGSVVFGTSVTLDALPDATSTFGGWTGCDSAVDSTCTVTMNANRTVTATFDPIPASSPVASGTTSRAIGEPLASPAAAGTWSANQ